MVREKLLMIRFNRGDCRVVRDIYALHKDELVSLAAALLHDKTSAEDAVHDVFAKLIARQQTLTITKNLRSYLLTAVANAARQTQTDCVMVNTFGLGGQAASLIVKKPD